MIETVKDEPKLATVSVQMNKLEGIWGGQFTGN